MKLRYRNIFLNWLYAKPWKWHYISIYKALRQAPVTSTTDKVDMLPSNRTGWKKNNAAYGRLRSAWYALCFPHVHDPEED